MMIILLGNTINLGASHTENLTEQKLKKLPTPIIQKNPRAKNAVRIPHLDQIPHSPGTVPGQMPGVWR